MSTTTKLTNQNTFENLTLIENHSQTAPADVYGWGVRGNKFSYVLKSDNFLKKIWFQFLKLIRMIKTDDASVNGLKDRTAAQVKEQSYNDWAKDNGKITKLGMQNLLARNQLLEQQAAAKQEPTDNEKTIKEKDDQIASLTAELAKFKKRAAKKSSHPHDKTPATDVSAEAAKPLKKSKPEIIKEHVKDTKDQVKEQTKEVIDQAKDKAKEVIDHAKGAIGNAAGHVQDAMTVQPDSSHKDHKTPPSKQPAAMVNP